MGSWEILGSLLVGCHLGCLLIGSYNFITITTFLWTSYLISPINLVSRYTGHVVELMILYLQFGSFTRREVWCFVSADLLKSHIQGFYTYSTLTVAFFSRLHFTLSFKYLSIYNFGGNTMITRVLRHAVHLSLES